ncbi:FG-GAP repeat domain-containing protein [Sandaracinus amylolyticus]|uniref:FG-GAP repeat domain-containing protein n=1 Tax=Sandaracinus amylolyticus TaxID=927083 RepID=UPI001F420A30|nr:VCBS repeat-containing protein [Sandaracinus amylolyticus]UJR81629.1 VCBS repeat-containing protein [Sandaracinus amylolyticus]
MSRSGCFVLFACVLSLAGCECGSTPIGACDSTNDCRAGQRCIDGMCTTTSVLDASHDDGATGSCSPACDDGELCVASVCAPDLGPCASSEECGADSYCEPTHMRCVPYGVPSGYVADSTCSRLVAAGTFAPSVQCEFTAAPAGDPFPTHLHVLSTPMVVDFAINRGPDEPHRPSIVAVFDDGVDGSSEVATGVIRILDGETCTQIAELGSLQIVAHSAPVALGDLDGDGRAEIVAYKAEPPSDGLTPATRGGLVAFTYDEDTSAWRVMWRSTRADGSPYEPVGGGWAGPSIYDLDDDGRPEVLRGAIVLDANGVLIDESSASLLNYGSGTFAVVANVDADADVELVGGHGVWSWNRTSRTWVAESWATGGQPHGHVAIADFGAFPGSASWPAEAPEVAVITAGNARIQTLDGTIVLPPIPLPGGGSGGPPTIADFDGDGLPEFASAGGSAYSVFDPDCSATPRTGGECASGTTTGVLWTQPSQDQSSNVTGSSVFDFEGDGRAEVVYGDECFVRVYDGESGSVLFSQSRSSCTWYENPVIADVDGDFNAEIVMGDNFNCGSAEFGTDCSRFGLGPRNTDPLFAGLRCADGADCVSGVCDAGFCRCTSDDQCCVGAGCAAAAFVCEVPPAGTPGTGNTCRASRPIGTRGIRVFRDGGDRWVRSRMIWSQHAYHVTNVRDDGTIPRTSEVGLNWREDGLNNFRANVQGDAIPGAAPDLTSRGDTRLCDATGGTAMLRATLCNRGASPIGAGVSATFYAGDPGAGGSAICSAVTTGDLRPGACEPLSCAWTSPPSTATDVWIVADPAGEAGECRESNNVSIVRDVRCDGVM